MNTRFKVGEVVYFNGWPTGEVKAKVKQKHPQHNSYLVEFFSNYRLTKCWVPACEMRVQPQGV